MRGAGYTAVCLTGSLRWPELTLPALRHLLTLWSRDANKLYYVGPADAAYRSAQDMLVNHFQVLSERVCAYPPNVTWVWRPPDLGSAATREAVASATFSTVNKDAAAANTSTAFALHGAGACQNRERVTLNVAWLPFFRRCRRGGKKAADAPAGRVELPEGLQMEGEGGWNRMSRYDRARAVPCARALSLVMQLWQCAQCLELIEATEQRQGGIPHDKVLRLRADLFFFRPVALPSLGDASQPKFSLMERTCNLEAEAGSHEMGRKEGPEFVHDFWSYGTRPAMRVVLREPLRRMLLYGLQQASRSRELGGVASPDGTASVAEDDAFEGTGAPNGAGGLPMSPRAFAAHPILYGIHFDLNASSCLPFSDPVGLLRVHPRQKCFSVQARIRHASLSGWMQLSIANVSAPKWHHRQRIVHQFEALVPSNAREQLPAVARVYGSCLGLRSDQDCPRGVDGDTLRNGPPAGCIRDRTDGVGATHSRSRRGRSQIFGPRVSDEDACGSSETLILPTDDDSPRTPEQAFQCVDGGLAKVYTDHVGMEEDFYSRAEPLMRMGGLSEDEIQAYWLTPEGDARPYGAESELTDGIR
jgi:hypothetical protein